MQLSNIVTIFNKEMTDTLRDRRTLIFMLLIPIAAIPLLMMGLSSLMVSQIAKVKEEASEIVIEGESFLPEELRSMFAEAPGLLIKTEDEFEGKDLMDELKQGNFQVLVVVSDGFGSDLERENQSEIEIFYDEAELKSEFAERKVKDLLTDYKDRVVQERMEGRGLSAEILSPFAVKSQNVAPPQKMAGKEFGMVLPYLIIIMCFMGAMYPAIDLAAGEKERGTLETLLTAPVNRFHILLGKFGVVVLTGLASAVVSMFGLYLGLRQSSKLPPEILDIIVKILGADTILSIFSLLLPLTVFFAGILLSVSLSARSFKEAQSLVTPLNIAVIIPAAIGMVPGVTMNFTTAVIPVLNVSLATREIIAGTMKTGNLVAVYVSLSAFAVLSLWGSALWFKRESTIFRS